MANPRPVHDLEAKWQEFWQEQGVYRAEDPGPKNRGQDYYGLIEFPYPSGEGLHVGHPRSQIAVDVVTRKRRMEGKNVLYPIGWDAFGLPTENFAIKNKMKPQDATAKNIANFRRQEKAIGLGFDWSREINTTDPAYYKWTQWQFLQFFKQGLAYKAKSWINWCPKDKIGLANEEVINGKCERCGTTVEKREKEQWMMAITKYADRLIDDLETVDYLSQVKSQQINWIGRSKGAYVNFFLADIPGQADEKHAVKVFTTRPDTIFGATFVAVSPELAQKWLDIGWQASKEVKVYVQENAAARSSREEEPEKTGVDTGLRAINPANGEKIPVWISNYVLGEVGTGAIMAVPAHDERDFAFAKKYGLPIKNVVDPVFVRPDVADTNDFKVKHKIVGIVEDGKGNVLTIHWPPELGGRLFLGGTIEAGETPEQTALRELAEETGYKDAEILEVGEETFDYKYFAHSKNAAFNAFTRFVHLRLRSLKQDKPSLEKDELGKFKVEWVPFAQARQEVLEPLHVYGFKKFIEKNGFAGEGVAARSGFLDGLPTWKAKEDMISWLEEQKKGERATTYKLRDWVFSRQRYWGEPIPIIRCAKCGFVPVPDDQLPVVLPDVEAYEPTDTGESPLAKMRSWVEVKCPNCGGEAERETDTMPNWAGSSWYFLRYCDPHNDQELASKEKLKYWLPIDLYNGGMEHTTLHLLYSRFWYKFLWDIGVVPKECGAEPFAKRRSHGLIMAEGGEKMSKSKGNVVNPDDVIAKYGADVFRLYLMFMGPYDQQVPWDTNGIEGVRRFLDKVWNLFEGSNIKASPELDMLYHQTVKKISDGIEQMQFNTCVSQMMILTNAYQDAEGIPEAHREGYLKILAPFAPHLADELWQQAGNKTSIHRSAWPAFDPSKLQAETFALVIQVNGKLRDKITVPSDITEAEAKTLALKSEKVQSFLAGKPPKQVVYVAGKLINMVI